VRAPGCCERRIAPGALCCRSGSPPIPAETGRQYSNYSLARLWLILAGPMASAINNLSARAQKRAEAPEGMRGGLRSNHRGIGGDACGWRLE
jgi:hypothetical protein